MVTVAGVEEPAPEAVESLANRRHARHKPHHRSRHRASPWLLLEGLAVLLSPAAIALAFRLRLMAPPGMPDPAEHTTFVVDPRDIFARYSAALTPTDRLREGFRAGFIVPARIAYLLFGSVPGFFVTRYAFALVAVVPIYVLLRRLYGRAAGALGILVFLCCPVVITALGTDYPDSAVVCYAAGALACLAMPSSRRRRWCWLALAGGLLTMAVWAHGMGLLIAAVTLPCYVLVRMVRERSHLLADLALMAAVAVLVTGVLSLASGLLVGPFNIVTPTWKAFVFLNQPSQQAIWHSTNWHWAPYVAYLLVPPAVVAAYALIFLRRGRSVPTPQLIVGAVLAAQVTAFFLLQFLGRLQTLEIHYFSSCLWASVCVATAVALSELGSSLLERRWTGWLLPGAFIAVVLLYEADPHVPAFGWAPYGLLTGALLIGSAAAGRLVLHGRHPAWRSAGALVAVTAILGCSLVLTVAPRPYHRLLDGTVPDPAPAYAVALGGSSAHYIDAYRVITELPFWVGHPSYDGEQLLTWWPLAQVGPLIGAIGIFHSGFNSILVTPPRLGARGRAMLARRHPAQVLVMSLTPLDCTAAVNALAPYDARLTREGVLRSGSYQLYLCLVTLGVYLRPHA